MSNSFNSADVNIFSSKIGMYLFHKYQLKLHLDSFFQITMKAVASQFLLFALNYFVDLVM